MSWDKIVNHISVSQNRVIPGIEFKITDCSVYADGSDCKYILNVVNSQWCTRSDTFFYHIWILPTQAKKVGYEITQAIKSEEGVICKTY